MSHEAGVPSGAARLTFSEVAVIGLQRGCMYVGSIVSARLRLNVRGPHDIERVAERRRRSLFC